MRLNAKELIAEARVTAPTLPPAATKLMSDMADRLDVQYAVICESREQLKQLTIDAGCYKRGMEASNERLLAVVAENAALKAGVKYFSYSEIAGFEEHETADAAMKSADADLSGERDEASSEGWSEETGTICWGVILQKAVEDKFESPSEENGWVGWSDYTLLPSIETPATDAAIASLRAEARAEGVNFAASRLAAAYNHGFIDKPLAEVGDVVRMILTAKDDLANNPAADGLSGEYAEKALSDWVSQLRQSALSPAILALPVERDEYGYWTHPAYDAFCDGREYVPTAEFNSWMEANGLEWTIDYRDEDEIDPAVDGYDISTWQPESPAGDGWFVGSIHDSEDGAVCVWLRNKSEASHERQLVQVKGVQS